MGEVVNKWGASWLGGGTAEVRGWRDSLVSGWVDGQLMNGAWMAELS